MFHKNTNYFNLIIKWEKSGDPEYPLYARMGDCKLQIKLNDFPEENLYSLIVDGEVVDSFDDWPACWER